MPEESREPIRMRINLKKGEVTFTTCHEERSFQNTESSNSGSSSSSSSSDESNIYDADSADEALAYHSNPDFHLSDDSMDEDLRLVDELIAKERKKLDEEPKKKSDKKA